MASLADYLDARLIKIPLAARAKTEAITELVDLINAAGRTRDRNRLLECVLAREQQRTTAIGRGLAIPHAKCDACGELVVAVGVPAEPLEFDAIDRQPVRLVVLLASAMAQASLQIQVLAKLSRLVLDDGVFGRIVTAPTPQEMLAVVREANSF
jgi:mannitol/fructose-specific phosphotransferase system IIA component (Ntr-type)